MPDLFGMNLFYDQRDSGLGNKTQFNGNISAVKWSNNLSLSATKSNGYTYKYDSMKRLVSANYLTNTASTWGNATNAFSESGYIYDLNGNIKHLKRMGASGNLLDSLNYSYGTQGNQLQSVTDNGGDLLNGFVDGNIGSTDYTYDPAGNMTTDKNKNIASITYNYLNLPQQVTKGTGENIKYTYDASGRKLKQQVYNASNALTKTTDYDGELIYQGTALGDTLKFINHEEGRVVMTGSTPEYQYHLKDHLGNVRTTFTTARNVDASKATFETANQNTEQSQFLRYDDARVINFTLFDHTNNGVTAYSERLSGTANERTGIARSISVMPGDTINLTVFAKYVDPANSNNTVALTSLIGQIVAGTASGGTVIDGANYSVNGITPFPYTGMAGEGSSSGIGPKAYLNYLAFDRNYNPILLDLSQTNSVQVTAGKEDGTRLPRGNKFDSLYAQVVVKQAGYMYIWLSNEGTTPMEVYFDDLTVQQIKSPIVQQEVFYPGGATFNSYVRENSVLQKYFYNSKEYQDDLALNLYNVHARQYDPWTLRTTTLDAHADRYHSLSSYSWCANNPVLNIDPTGKDIIIDITRNNAGEITGVNLKSTVIITGEGASQDRADDLNKNSNDVFKSRTLKNGVKVSFDIKYQYKKDFKAKDLKAGDNLLNFVNKASVENSEQSERDVSHVNGNKQFSTNPTLYTAGNTGEIYKDDWNDNQTILHESVRSIRFCW